MNVPRAGSGVVRIDPLRFLAGHCKRWLNQVWLCLSYILACFIILLFIKAPFLCIVSFRCYVFCILVDLAKLSVLAKWLARETPLRKPNCGEEVVSRKSRLKSAYDFLGLLYCFIVLLCACVVSWPYMIYFPTNISRYSLFVLNLPLNTKQTDKQIMHECLKLVHLFYWVPVGLYAIVWSTGRRALNYWMKRQWKDLILGGFRSMNLVNSYKGKRCIHLI